MKRSLRGSRQQPLPDMNNLNQTAQNIDPAMLNDVQSVVDKYGGKSEQELIGELAAAKRSGIRTVIIPRENEKDLADIDPAVREALRFITAETVDAVFAHALTLPKKEAAVEHLAVMGSPAMQEVRHGDQL